ncbi:MAG: CCA tRNA nucleotidyltransferase [Elusimicrobia bacterium]|nr:CCA tRNA nucleotidyltransferase [Elusimicrobiota bacterium]
MRLAPRLARAAAELGRRAAEAGLRAAVVGGCVRDALLERTMRDLDVAVEGDAEALARKCAADWGVSCETFGRFGTARLAWASGERLDVARARTEHYPEPAALPVVSPATIEEDLKRRDFTVNAMARLLTPDGVGKRLDPFRGETDLDSKILKVLHRQSFRDDPTRLFRGARYAGRLGLKPDAETAELIKESVARKDPALVSRERLRQELWRILEERDPGPALGLCRKWGLGEFLHADFRAPAKLDAHPGALTRLGLIAFSMGEAGEDFVASFPFPREEASAVKTALAAAKAKATPAQVLSEAAAKILHAAFPDLPKAATKARLVTGANLIAAGQKPGPGFMKVLEEAAAEQWAGRIGTAGEAGEWVTKRLG